MEYTCPVCGYNKLEDPPFDDEICPSCGTQFGYHDHKRSHAELRAIWLTNPTWHSRVDDQPDGWNPYTQLANLEMPSTTESMAKTQITFVDLGKTHHIENRGITGYSIDAGWQIISRGAWAVSA